MTTLTNKSPQPKRRLIFSNRSPPYKRVTGNANPRKLGQPGKNNWTCAKCQYNNNFPRNLICHKCKAPRNHGSRGPGGLTTPPYRSLSPEAKPAPPSYDFSQNYHVPFGPNAFVFSYDYEDYIRLYKDYEPPTRMELWEKHDSKFLQNQKGKWDIVANVPPMQRWEILAAVSAEDRIFSVWDDYMGMEIDSEIIHELKELGNRQGGKKLSFDMCGLNTRNLFPHPENMKETYPGEPTAGVEFLIRAIQQGIILVTEVDRFPTDDHFVHAASEMHNRDYIAFKDAFRVLMENMSSDRKISESGIPLNEWPDFLPKEARHVGKCMTVLRNSVTHEWGRTHREISGAVNLFNFIKREFKTTVLPCFLIKLHEISGYHSDIQSDPPKIKSLTKIVFDDLRRISTRLKLETEPLHAPRVYNRHMWKEVPVKERLDLIDKGSIPDDKKWWADPERPTDMRKWLDENPQYASGSYSPIKAVHVVRKGRH